MSSTTRRAPRCGRNRRRNHRSRRRSTESNRDRRLPCPQHMPGEHGCRRPNRGIRYTASTYTGCSPVCRRWPGSTGKEDAVCTTERRERDTRYIALCSRVASGPASGSDNARGAPPLAFSNPARRDRAVGGCGRQSPSPSLQLLFHAQRPTIDCWCGVASANNSRAQAPYGGPTEDSRFLATAGATVV
jgi:hypothetical protein